MTGGHLPQASTQGAYQYPQNMMSPEGRRSVPTSPPVYSNTSIRSQDYGIGSEKQNSGNHNVPYMHTQTRVSSSNTSPNNGILTDYGNFFFDSLIQQKNEQQPHRNHRSEANSQVSSQKTSPVHQFSGQNTPQLNHNFTNLAQGNHHQNVMSRGSPSLPTTNQLNSPLSPLMGTLWGPKSLPKQPPAIAGLASAPTSPGLVYANNINDSMAPFFNQ